MEISVLLLRLGDYGDHGGFDSPNSGLGKDLDAGFSPTLRAPKLMGAFLDLELYARLSTGAAWDG